jgi:tRNA threonylcarbamoyladenosine biosynthesis protein TsaB
MLILGIETATAQASVALVKKGALVAEIIFSRRLGHAETILLAIDRLLKKAKVRPQELKMIAVGVGPGSYTGLRVGIATARGLALVHRVPVVGIASLDAIVASPLAQWPKEAKTIYAAIDAKRGEFYVAEYRRQQDHFSRKGKIKLISNADLEALKNKVNALYPTAAGVAFLAGDQAYQHKMTSNIEPIYLRPFVATKTEQQKSACFTGVGQKSI